MAKKPVEIKDTSFIYNIDLSSKDTTFVFKTTAQTTVDFEPTNVTGTYNSSRYIKDGKDLKYVTVYYDQNTFAVKKRITMTVLDYDSHYSKYDDIFKNNGSTALPSYFFIQSTGNAIVGSMARYAGTDKADKFTITGGGNITIDYKGNDSYNVAPWDNATSTVSITDYTGNDKYSVSVLPKTTIDDDNYGEQAWVYIYDYSGNDIYTLKGPDEDGITAYIHDYNGNDKYNVNGVRRVEIIDYNKGKDTYNISNTLYGYVRDTGGNDTYNVANSKIEIKENLKAGSITDVYGTSGNETYNLNSLIADSKVYDMLGNDKYNINYAQGESDNKVTITDNDGKDTYKITGSKYITLADTNGNDTYNLVDSDRLDITDGIKDEKKPENESYTLKTVSNSELKDWFGNDSYKIDLSLNTLIDNWGGTDKYTITNSNGISLQDNAYKTSSAVVTRAYGDGNDTFTVKDSIETTIYSGRGDDKFTVSDDSMRTIINDVTGNEKYDIKDSALVQITDRAGDDTYKLTNVDNYNIEVSGTETDDGELDYNIKDNAGSDKYDIKNSRSICVYDDATSSGEKNTFNITSGESINITTGEKGTVYSEDIYNLTSNSEVTVREYGDSKDTYNLTSNKLATIIDYNNSDTYNLKSNVNVEITDWGTANDTYNLDKLTGRLSISDLGGDKDSLIIKSAKSKDIVFMADARTDNGHLYAYDMKNGGYVRLVHYYSFTHTEDEYHLTGYGNGRIETVKFGNSDADIKAAVDMDVYQQDVTTFLTTGAGSEYGTIKKVLDSGDSDVIKGLIACFNN